MCGGGGGGSGDEVNALPSTVFQSKGKEKCIDRGGREVSQVEK